MAPLKRSKRKYFDFAHFFVCAEGPHPYFDFAFTGVAATCRGCQFSQSVLHLDYRRDAQKVPGLTPGGEVTPGNPYRKWGQ